MIVDVERVAHGGSCVGHTPDGRVVFVRHTLPGEQVRVVVTDEHASFLRADAVEVLRASPARVARPCPWAGPGRCGGCDWQHVDLGEQRRLKANVVAEQLHRLAGIDRDVVVEPVPGDDSGLGWRTRMRLAVDARGRAGLRRHRSHELEPIGDCLIADDRADVPGLVARHWPPDVEVTVDVTSTGDRAVAVGTHRDTITEQAAGRRWEVPVGGFWQVHVGAAELLARTVVSMAKVQPEDECLDLYAGVGLFAGALAPFARRVTAVESEPRAVAAARRNVADLGNVAVVRGRVDSWLQRRDVRADVVVLDPPRRGAGRAVATRLVELAPRRIVYVACDPAALARDLATFADGGYALEDLRAFDLFPMTAHVECVAALTSTAPPLAPPPP